MFEKLGEELIEEIAEKTLNKTLSNIIDELPHKHESSIANQIYVERTGTLKFAIITETPVWGYLNSGTGVFGATGQPITPKNAKVLAFKNKELAMALGFKTEMVFLASVKGIKPRWFWERHISSNRFNEVWNSVIVNR